MGHGSVTLYVATVVALGAVSLAAGARTIHLESLDPLMVVLLVGIAAVAQRFPVALFRSSAISVSFAAVVAAYVLYGAGAGVFTSLAQGAVCAFTPTRKALRKAAFNFGAFALSAFAAGEAYRLAGGANPPSGIPLTLAAVTASAIPYFVVNTGLTAGAIALSEGRGFFAIWRTNYAWMPLNYLATAAQGAAMALAYQALSIFGVLVFMLPLAAAWASFRLYMAKSREVRQRNDELETTNQLLASTKERLEASHVSVIGALIGALEAKEAQLSGHAARAMFLSVEVAQRLGLPVSDIAAIRLAALFHDIGKIGVPEHLLRKPASLTEEEWVEVRAHPVIGANLLGNVPMLEGIAKIVVAHHERYDGTGYPRGIKGGDIPLSAQIISVADAYEAMTESRPYRSPRTPKEALRELRAFAGSQFNPVVVEAFISTVVAERRLARRRVEHVDEHQLAYLQAIEAVRVAS